MNSKGFIKKNLKKFKGGDKKKKGEKEMNLLTKFSKWLRHKMREAEEGMGMGIIEMESELSAVVIRDGVRENLGVICRKKVTDAFVEYIVDNLIAEATAFGDFKFHDSGIGTTAEDKTQTALVTPWGGARTTGSQIEGASAHIYKSVATTTYNATKAITEHGLFNIAAAGIMMDRHNFAAINVVDTNQIEWTYNLTINSEA